ncbi:MAG: hypothetical protein KF753_02120 [Caldilineaceae bacterium]|nr:hypothetical protein [Caldilineaceae bacterium]
MSNPMPNFWPVLQSPPTEFTVIPFWFWHDDLNGVVPATREQTEFVNGGEVSLARYELTLLMAGE